jgi:hypothetical protein
VDYVYVRLTDGTDSSSLDGSGNLEVVGEAGIALATEASLEACETALEIIDDWDATHDGGVSADGAQVMGGAAVTVLPSAVVDADASRFLVDAYGRILPGTMPEKFEATTNTGNATSAHPIKVKTAGRKMYITTMIISAKTAMDVRIQDDTGPTVMIDWIYLPATGGFTHNWPDSAPLVVNTNEDLDIITSAAGFVSVYVSGYLAP